MFSTATTNGVALPILQPTYLCIKIVANQIVTQSPVTNDNSNFGTEQ